LCRHDYSISENSSFLQNDYLHKISYTPSPDYITSILAVTSHLEGPMTGTELNNVMQNVNNAMKKNGLLKSYNTFSNLHKIKSEDLNNIRDLINSINLDKTELNR
jgi:hypothetical protein